MAAEHIQPQAGVLQLANDMAISAGGWDAAYASVCELLTSKTVTDSWIEVKHLRQLQFDYSLQPATGLIARERQLISKSLLADLASLLFPCCARADLLAFVDLHCSSG